MTERGQIESLMDELLREVNDEGPWGDGYRQAMDDLREQIEMRFGSLAGHEAISCITYPFDGE